MTYDEAILRAKNLAYQSPAYAHWIKDWNTLEDTLKASPNAKAIEDAALNETRRSHQEAACVIIAMLS